MDLPVEVTWPPMLYTDRSGQKWAVSGQHWVEVPETLTLDRVGEYMVVAERKERAPLAEVRTYDVVGSNVKHPLYRVTFAPMRFKAARGIPTL